MNTSVSSPVSNETIDAVVARIDAQPEAYGEPFREFLQTAGCEVFVNQMPDRTPAYSLAVGSREFVKSIFLSPGPAVQKRLAILVGMPPLPVEWQERTGIRMICIDAVVPPPAQVERIFAFFFTDSAPVLDLRRTQPTTGESTQQAEPTSLAPEPEPESNGSGQAVLPQTDQKETKRHVRESPVTSENEDRQRIQAAIASVFAEPAAPRVRRRRHPRLRPWSLVLLAVVIIIFPLAWYAASLSVSVSSLVFASRKLLLGDTGQAAVADRIGEYWIGQAQGALWLMAIPLRGLGQERRIRGQERFLSLLSDAAVSEQGVVALLRGGHELSNSLLSAAGTNTEAPVPAVALEALRSQLYIVQNHLGLAQANLDSLLRDHTFPFSVTAAAAAGGRQEAVLLQLRSQLIAIDQLLTLYPLMAGFRQKQTYLILFQNSMELRPTGGFIGSLGLLSFVDGRMDDFRIQDVYEVDGQLRGHVDPPGPIRELLGQEHWYLRDSNWDPDFLTSGTRAAWFYEKETGIKVDGVIGVSAPFVVSLLKTTGPIDLPDYNDRITADNFWGKSLFYTQTDFFPGSTQKKDFLGALGSALLTKLTATRNLNPSAVFRATSDALSSHDIAFAFPNSQLQTLVERYGWADRWPVPSACASEALDTCVWDPLDIAEANLSVSKVNYFVNRSQIRQVSLDSQGQIEETVSLVYHNSAGPQQPGAGSYRTYVRFWLPPEATLSAMTIDGAPVASRSGDKSVPLLPYREPDDSRSNSQGWGVAFDVPPQAERRLSVSYRRGSGLNQTQGKANFLLYSQKQPGISDENLQFIFEYPNGLIADLTGPGDKQNLLANQGRVEYNTTLTHDLLLNIRLTKQ